MPADLAIQYNTAVVLIGAGLLGACGGVAGVFALLRRRSLVSDAVGHATLPGIAAAFLVSLALGGDGRSLPLLLAGALAAGALATLMITWIKAQTRLTEDTAIATVLAVFFGLGAVLLSHIQTLPVSGQAGLNSFLLGSTAAMSAGEATTIGALALMVIACVAALFKELRALAFDPGFATALGLPTGRLDLYLMGVLLFVVAIGLKTVGLILIVAIVVLPPAAARFWTERLTRMAWLSGLFGALAGFTGAAASALVADLPTGGAIVLAGGALLLVSLLFAPARGMLPRRLRRAGLERRLGRTGP